ncbi:uncharacterized protein [Nicotiana tomentosiformis]|uniref:uncharacterized protein isoform X2 n=1 Tax=Nicotiana tomentosiformis TaxID=4098 RepID=UPI00388CA6E8
MIHDAFGGVTQFMDNDISEIGGMEQSIQENTAHQSGNQPYPEVDKFERLMKEENEELYPGCTYKTIDLVGAEAWLLRGISFGATGISLNCRSGFGAGYGISEQGTYKTSDLVGAEALLLRGLS